MTQPEKPDERPELSFPPVEPPPFPGEQSSKSGISRRKLAAIAGAVPLGAVAVGAVYIARNDETAGSAAAKGSVATSAPRNAANFGAVPTQTEPRPDLAPEISKIGSRHIAALHAIHLYMSHISTYDPQSLDQYFAGAIDATTGAYRQHLIDTHGATRDYFLATNQRSEVLDFNCGLRAITGATALGVGYVKRSTTSDATPGPAISLAATVITAEEQPDGRWLVSDMKLIST
ncbi:hypothetical protein BJY24_001404 [Nocardia transvalensis]|uniref:Mce-associated membrane protein n=1 Tax=Nocardia transvalensis TaxID=37333 RepID=A0A7W9PAN3_9NOCA|nr:hypothetical protein [Nocardia transvalensis]MBB5912537.1 hypothetical protein [Nocardia transvalensis]